MEGVFPLFVDGSAYILYCFGFSGNP